MLTREAIHSGAYLEHFESLPCVWKREQILDSLAETLNRRPAGAQNVWLFAYGSLMWNPALHFDTRRVATLHGWHRAFCLRMEIGRGSPETPGRMLALRPGGHTKGVALRLCAQSLEDELKLLWTREMVLGSYRPIWAAITLDDGIDTHAIAFVADESRAQFEADASVNTIAPLIAGASGAFGSNADYLMQLQSALDACGLRDPYVDALAGEVERLCARADASE
jgi:glutathione-specific gamma-glutamylcyclotransferase